MDLTELTERRILSKVRRSVDAFHFWIDFNNVFGYFSNVGAKEAAAHLLRELVTRCDYLRINFHGGEQQDTVNLLNCIDCIEGEVGNWFNETSLTTHISLDPYFKAAFYISGTCWSEHNA